MQPWGNLPMSNVFKDWRDIMSDFDRTFDSFEKEMEQTRRDWLKTYNEDKNKQLTLPTYHSYQKESHNEESRVLTVKDHTLKFKICEMTKERDGVKIPHIIKQFEVEPPADVNLLTDYSHMKETIGSKN